MNRKKPQKIPPISSFLVNTNNFLFINSKVSRVAMPNRKVAKEKGGASFSASLTMMKVIPQIMVTIMRPIFASDLFCIIFVS